MILDIRGLLNLLDNHLNNTWADCQDIREQVDKLLGLDKLTLKEFKKAMERINVSALDVQKIIENYQDMIGSLKVVVNETEEENKRLKEENIKLLKELEILKKELEDKQNKEIEALKEAVELINTNSKAIALSRKLSNKEGDKEMQGKNHPRYRDDIDNAELVKVYNTPGTTLKQLAEKYEMSIPGIRNRLIDLGVYESKYKK